MDVMNDWWMAVERADLLVALLAMVVSGISLSVCWRMSRTLSASTKIGLRALEESQEAHRLAAAALDVSNDLGTQVAELKRLRVQQHDNRPMKAELTARIRRKRRKGETSEGDSAWFFRVENHGAAPARNMKVLVDGKTAHDHPAIFAPPHEPTTLAPQGFIEYPLAVPLVPEQRRPLSVRITWDDDSRADRIEDFTINAE